MQNNITLSIRLMVYNNEPYIKEALDSIFMQKVNFHVEVVVGDDFSTDRTLEIIKGYKNTNFIHLKILDRPVNGLYYIKRKKLGRVYNFINIINNCKGKYIALLDGDDYWTDEYKLQKQVDFLEKNKTYVICFHNAKMEYLYYPNESIKTLFYEGHKTHFTIEDTFGEVFVPSASLVFRKIENFKFPSWFTRVASADITLISLLATHGNIKYIDEPMSNYRLHPNGLSSSHYNLKNYAKHRIFIFQQLDSHYDFKYTKVIQKEIDRIINMLYSHTENNSIRNLPKNILKVVRNYIKKKLLNLYKK